MKYRAEIDGLRAISVISVVFFHAGFELFSGGFVGVDIFFVISGYLITTLLIEELESNRFNIINFYERRARRILPALFFVMLVCIPFAVLWMLPSQMKEFSYSLIAVSLFISNILFWRESGYFAAAAEEKPLLHTWSLAVEEQYYVLFPVFLFLAWRFGKERVLWIIVALAAISLALSEWGSRNMASANFYLAPTRAWELFAGSIAAFVVNKRGVKSSNVLSAIGLAAIIVSIFAFDESIPFPSIYALLPVVGVVLLLFYAEKRTFVAKLLSTKLFVGVGLISYSVYLWHQPLFAFAKIRSTERPSTHEIYLLVLFSFLLAIATWKFVEQPFRRIRSHKIIFSFSVFGISAFVFFGMIGVKANGKINAHITQPPNLVWNSLGEKISEVGLVCDWDKVLDPTESWLRGCSFGKQDGQRNLVLLGDSHSQAISYQLKSFADKFGFKVFWFRIEGCEPVPYVRMSRNSSIADCDIKFEKLLTHIKALKADVVLLNRWTFRLYPIEGVKLDMPYRGSEGGVENEGYREFDVYKNGRFFRDKESKTQAVETFIRKIAVSSARVFLIYPVPETAIDVSKKNWKYWNAHNEVLSRIDIPYTEYTDRNAFINGIFDRMKISNLIKIKTDMLFCNRTVVGRCDVQVDGIPLYFDNDHLSDEGAKLVVDAVAERI